MAKRKTKARGTPPEAPAAPGPPPRLQDIADYLESIEDRLEDLWQRDEILAIAIQEVAHAVGVTFTVPPKPVTPKSKKRRPKSGR